MSGNQDHAGRSMMQATLGVAAGAAGAVERLGRMVGGSLGLPGLRRKEARRLRKPGGRPGIEHHPEVDQPPAPEQVHVRCIDYGPNKVESFEVGDMAGFFAQPRPEWAKVRWVNVDGLHPYVLNQFREQYKFHTLAAEDALHVPQRAKIDPYDDHLFIVAHMLRLEGGELLSEQVSFFFYNDTLITFQQRPGDVWQPIRDRINAEGSRLRQNGPGYLLYALLDAVVDHCFPILEYYGDTLEQMEDQVLAAPGQELLQRLHAVKRELAIIRRLMWSMRDVLDKLHRDESGRLSDIARTYMRDVYDHAFQVIDILEAYREMAGGLTDLYMSAMSNRMNEVMKVLTIMASFFIPITFLAGVYGMNFKYIPELTWPYAYATFWIICLAATLGLFIFFRRRGWLGRSR